MVSFDELAMQNPWWGDSANINADGKIKSFDSATLRWYPRLRRYLDLDKDVLYSIRGPRQVGKTTLVKLIVRDLLKERKPFDIFYYSCELVKDPKELYSILDTFLQWSRHQGPGRKLICLDEITQVESWESAYKQFVDINSLRNMTVILTGSSSWDLKHSVERLGGRKGEITGEQNNKILLPMKFAEYVKLRKPRIYDKLDGMGLYENQKRKEAFISLMGPNSYQWIDPLLPFKGELDALLDEYFITGGVMSAVNPYVNNNEIPSTTYEMYLQLFFGDVARIKRDEGTARKVLSAILNHPHSAVGWERLSGEAGIPSAPTVMQYADVLRNLFVINVYNGLDQNKKQPKQRSEKKFQITNPFFFHAFHGYLTNPAGDFFQQAKAFLSNSEGKAALAEFVVGDHITRLAYNFSPSDIFDQENFVFYVRNSAGESVDFMVRLPDGFLPIEVKFQNQINPSDFKNIEKFERGILVSKDFVSLGTAHPSIPISLFLLFI
jgi:hypothetical protein